jgi:hypothetical protein
MSDIARVRGSPNRPVELLVAWSKLDNVRIIAGVVTTPFRLRIIE